MSRPALTEEQQRLFGRPSRAAADAGSARPGRAAKPSHLSPEAAAVWRRVTKLLGARRTETPGDFASIAVFCECYARWVQAKKELGMALMIDVTVLDNHGEPHVNRKLNPLLKVVEAAERNVLTLARELGLTPLLRERVKPAKEDPKPNPLDAHLRPSGYTVEDQLRGRVPHD